MEENDYTQKTVNEMIEKILSPETKGVDITFVVLDPPVSCVGRQYVSFLPIVVYAIGEKY